MAKSIKSSTHALHQLGAAHWLALPWQTDRRLVGVAAHFEHRYFTAYNEYLAMFARPAPPTRSRPPAPFDCRADRLGRRLPLLSPSTAQVWHRGTVSLADTVRRYRTETLPLFPPVFHKWFVINFPDPTAWLEARTVSPALCEKALRRKAAAAAVSPLHLTLPLRACCVPLRRPSRARPPCGPWWATSLGSVTGTARTCCWTSRTASVCTSTSVSAAHGGRCPLRSPSSCASLAKP